MVRAQRKDSPFKERNSPRRSRLWDEKQEKKRCVNNCVTETYSKSSTTNQAGMDNAEMSRQMQTADEDADADEK